MTAAFLGTKVVHIMRTRCIVFYNNIDNTDKTNDTDNTNINIDNVNTDIANDTPTGTIATMMIYLYW